MNTVKGFVGMIMSITFPFIDYINPAVQVIGALAGLFLVYLSIKYKRLQIKNEQMVSKHLNDN